MRRGLDFLKGGVKAGFYGVFCLKMSPRGFYSVNIETLW